MYVKLRCVLLNGLVPAPSSEGDEDGGNNIEDGGIDHFILQ